MSLKEKLQKFSELCGDWDYRNIDMTDSHIQRIDIEKDDISISCELFSTERDDYVSCDGGTFKDKSLISKFKKLNLNKQEDVLDFISSLNNLVDWNKVDNDLNKEIEIERKNIDSVVDSDVLVEDDYDDMEAKIVPCKKLGEGWFWHKYNDGSGHLQSPEGKEYMSYDLCTNEYMVDRNSKDYDLFPLSYYYVDGVDSSKFDAFDFMEQEMIDVILPREKETAKLLDSNIKILGTWLTDYDDMRCNAIIIQDNKEVANIIASYDECDLRHSIGNKDSEMNEEFIKRAFQTLIYDEIKDYLKLPKISNCSNLLQDIYDAVCESDATMCHISDEDWNDYYTDNYSEDDIEVLKEEIKKYGLDEIIGINDGEYKIVGYGDLETRFNDDRRLELNNECDLVI